MTPAEYAQLRVRLGFIPTPPRIRQVSIYRPRQGPPCPELLPSNHEWQRIVNRVTLKTGVTFAQMVANWSRGIAWRAKTECWYSLRQEVDIAGRPMSYPMIGEKFHRDHTTIIHGAFRWADLNGLDRPR